mmetsp:Transcript_37102/g.90500  ORF Transcript_37102/g.90500 Transcript_37102/m.90500 type:complete len:220 (-) Transcript_37102:1117-1776(-)
MKNMYADIAFLGAFLSFLARFFFSCPLPAGGAGFAFFTGSSFFAFFGRASSWSLSASSSLPSPSCSSWLRFFLMFAPSSSISPSSYSSSTSDSAPGAKSSSSDSSSSSSSPPASACSWLRYGSFTSSSSSPPPSSINVSARTFLMRIFLSVRKRYSSLYTPRCRLTNWCDELSFMCTVRSKVRAVDCCADTRLNSTLLTFSNSMNSGLLAMKKKTLSSG